MPDMGSLLAAWLRWSDCYNDNGMPEITTSKSGTRTPVKSGKGRLGFALFQGAKTVVFAVARTIYVLWLEITGVAFAGFAVMGASALVRLYRKHAWIDDSHRFWVTVFFTAGCIWLTIASFWRARRTRGRTRR
ncbi:MAG: hypothetical protein LAP21_19310 [Acidobacteriia bacterium]|nr:hypothetical protein [Terriglobia bacterium]